MRTDRLSRCLGILLGIGLLSAFAVSKEDAGRTRPTDLNTAVDPDGELVAVSTDGVLAAVGAEDCQVFGLRDQRAESFGLPRFRGNIYRVEFANVELTEIKMEFDIPVGAEVDLFFSVHRLADAPPPESYVRFTNDVVSSGGIFCQPRNIACRHQCSQLRGSRDFAKAGHGGGLSASRHTGRASGIGEPARYGDGIRSAGAIDWVGV